MKGGDYKMPRPLRYGQGGITKRSRLRKDGSEYTWHEGAYTNEYGKRVRITGKTHAEVYNRLRKENPRTLKTEKYKQPIKNFGISFQEWYEVFKKPKIQPKDDRWYQKLMAELPKDITQKTLSQITDTELQAHLNGVPNARNRHEIKALLCAFLKRMFIKGLIKVDIARLLVAPKPKAAKRQILPRDKEYEFLNLVSATYRTHVKVALYTGCRYSELMRIKEHHVDRTNKQIKILGTKGAKLQGYAERERRIPLLPTIEQIQFPLKRISYSRLADNVRKVCEQVGVKITMQDLKHTFATRCREAGVDLKTYSEWLDHANIGITADLYSAHTTKELFEQEASKLRNSTSISTSLCTENRTDDDE